MVWTECSRWIKWRKKQHICRWNLVPQKLQEVSESRQPAGGACRLFKLPCCQSAAWPACCTDNKRVNTRHYSVFTIHWLLKHRVGRGSVQKGGGEGGKKSMILCIQPPWGWLGVNKFGEDLHNLFTQDWVTRERADIRPAGLPSYHITSTRRVRTFHHMPEEISGASRRR